MSLSFDVSIRMGGFEKALLEAVIKHINAALKSSRVDIENEIGNLFERSVKASTEYKSMTSGVLKKDLGLIDPVDYLDDIINTIKENIVIKDTPIPNRSPINKGGISINLIRSSYRDILSLDGSSFTSKKGYLIKWLQWMLTQGDDVIIDNYVVSHNDYPSPPSRTGEALMFKRPGGVYRIPPQFSGLPGKNFLTRAIENKESEIVSILERCLERYL